MRAAKPVRLTVHYDQGPAWELPTVEVLWRCSGCGKWSHAVRRPPSHQRFLHDGEVLPHNADVLDEREAEYDYEGSEVRGGGTMIRCGPFQQWIAGLASS